MDVEQKEILQYDRPTVLSKADLFGKAGSAISFDHREESEPVGNFLAGMRIDSISLWFQRSDVDNVALQGICTSFKKLSEDNFFESYEAVSDDIKNADRDYDIVHFDDGEYIKGIRLITAQNGHIGAIEFHTTLKGRKVVAFGSPNANAEEGKQTDPLPKGTETVFDFLKPDAGFGNGYVVGFYGEYDGNYVTHLGVYLASFTEVNYYSRRPYILTFKKLQGQPEMIDEIAKKLNLEKDGKKFKDANLEDTDENPAKVLLYFLNSSLNNPELFKSVLEYL